MTHHELTHDQAKDRLAKLRDQINEYRYRYHVLDESIMSEAAADSLKHELSQLEEQYPDLITPDDSPTQRVAGKPSDRFAKIRHTQPMISLNDVFSEDEVVAWATRISKLLGNEGGKKEASDEQASAGSDTAHTEEADRVHEREADTSFGSSMEFFSSPTPKWTASPAPSFIKTASSPKPSPAATAK
jgi:hypothetical protein